MEKDSSHGSDLSYHNESVTEVWKKTTTSLRNTVSIKTLQ